MSQDTIVLIIHMIAFLVVIALIVSIIAAIRLSKKRIKSIQASNRARTIYQDLVESSPVPFIIHHHGEILFFNQATVDLVGYSEEEIKNQNILRFVAETGIIDAKKRLAKGFIQQTVFEQVLLSKSGELIEVEITAVETEYEGKPAVQMILHDLRHHKRAERTISHMAFHDFLTGLPNRVSFRVESEKMLKQVKKDNALAIILLDLDHFKKINDTFGHSAGDDFLVYVSKSLKEIIGEDNPLFRLSGDEFTILMPNVKNQEQVVELAKKIITHLRKPYTIESYKFHVTSSIGIMIIEDNQICLEEVLKDADAALYQAKEKGRNNFIFYDEKMRRDMLDKVKLETELRLAIENHELEMHYQPQLNSFTGETIGLEALIRWNKGGSGYISPIQFISLAEETGLIFPLGEFIFKEVCRQTKEWERKGYKKVRVAVNLSLIQFQQLNFLDFIKNTLQDYDLDPSWIEIEITESIFLQDLEKITAILREMQSMGIRVAIDDFGTGYSSLNYLKNLPIDKLKIDRSFIKDMPNNMSDTSITKTIIALAKNLNKDVIAEGVETTEQLELLKEFNCEGVQGFLFSKPLEPNRVEEFLLTTPTK